MVNVAESWQPQPCKSSLRLLSQVDGCVSAMGLEQDTDDVARYSIHLAIFSNLPGMQKMLLLTSDEEVWETLDVHLILKMLTPPFRQSANQSSVNPIVTHTMTAWCCRSGFTDPSHRPPCK